jgi:hypothetical protein
MSVFSTHVPEPRLSGEPADPADPLKRASPLHASYAKFYEWAPVGGWWYAVSLRGGPPLDAATEAELADLIRTDYARRGVS